MAVPRTSAAVLTCTRWVVGGAGRRGVPWGMGGYGGGVGYGRVQGERGYREGRERCTRCSRARVQAARKASSA